MNSQEVCLWILNEANGKELEDIVNAFRFRKSRQEQEQKAQFSPGDKIWFTGRRGNRLEGVVIEIMKKNIRVLVDSDGPGSGTNQWRVHPSFLHKL